MKLQEFSVKLNWFEALELKYAIKRELQIKIDMLSDIPDISDGCRQALFKDARKLKSVLLQINDILNNDIYIFN